MTPETDTARALKLIEEGVAILRNAEKDKEVNHSAHTRFLSAVKRLVNDPSGDLSPYSTVTTRLDEASRLSLFQGGSDLSRAFRGYQRRTGYAYSTVLAHFAGVLAELIKSGAIGQPEEPKSLEVCPVETRERPTPTYGEWDALNLLRNMGGKASSGAWQDAFLEETCYSPSSFYRFRKGLEGKGYIRKASRPKGCFPTYEVV